MSDRSTDISLRSRLLIGGAHGTWMLVLTVVTLSHFGLVTDDESLLIQASTIARQALMDPGSRSAYQDEFTFIDVAYDLAVVPKMDSDGFPLGEQAITDRAQLAALFRLMNAFDVHRFVVCDVFFEAPSSNDPPLEAELSRMRDVVVPYHLDATGTPMMPVIDAPAALADYPQEMNSFLKFPIIQADSLETLPLHMHRALHPHRPLLESPLALNTFVPDFRLPPQAIGSPVPLGHLLQLPDSVVAHDFLRDRIVVLGDFSGGSDLHETVVGDVPGSLILANLYLSLREGDHRLPLSLLLLLWVVFGFLSYTVVTHADREEGEDKIQTWAGALRDLGTDGAQNTIILILVSLVAYFGYRVHLHVLFLAASLTIVGNAVKYRAEIAGWWRFVRHPRSVMPEPASPSSSRSTSPPPNGPLASGAGSAEAKSSS